MELDKYRIVVVVLLLYALYCVHQLKTKREGFSASLNGTKVADFNSFVHNLENNRITGNFRIQGRLQVGGKALINKGYVFLTKRPEQNGINQVIADPKNSVNNATTVILNGYNPKDNLLWTKVNGNNRKFGL